MTQVGDDCNDNDDYTFFDVCRADGDCRGVITPCSGVECGSCKVCDHTDGSCDPYPKHEDCESCHHCAIDQRTEFITTILENSYTSTTGLGAYFDVTIRNFVYISHMVGNLWYAPSDVEVWYRTGTTGSSPNVANGGWKKIAGKVRLIDGTGSVFGVGKEFAPGDYVFFVSATNHLALSWINGYGVGMTYVDDGRIAIKAGYTSNYAVLAEDGYKQPAWGLVWNGRFYYQ